MRIGRIVADMAAISVLPLSSAERIGKVCHWSLGKCLTSSLASVSVLCVPAAFAVAFNNEGFYSDVLSRVYYGFSERFAQAFVRSYVELVLGFSLWLAFAVTLYLLSVSRSRRCLRNALVFSSGTGLLYWLGVVVPLTMVHIQDILAWCLFRDLLDLTKVWHLLMRKTGDTVIGDWTTVLMRLPFLLAAGLLLARLLIVHRRLGGWPGQD